MCVKVKVSYNGECCCWVEMGDVTLALSVWKLFQRHGASGKEEELMRRLEEGEKQKEWSIVAKDMLSQEGKKKREKGVEGQAGRGVRSDACLYHSCHACPFLPAFIQAILFFTGFFCQPFIFKIKLCRWQACRTC